MDNYPCVCSHPKSAHRKRELSVCKNIKSTMGCIECAIIEIRGHPDKMDFKSFHDFKGDNLKYLEGKING